MMVSVEHPRIVRFIDVAWDSLTDLCAVSEFMDGGDCARILVMISLGQLRIEFSSNAIGTRGFGPDSKTKCRRGALPLAGHRTDVRGLHDLTGESSQHSFDNFHAKDSDSYASTTTSAPASTTVTPTSTTSTPKAPTMAPPPTDSSTISSVSDTTSSDPGSPSSSESISSPMTTTPPGTTSSPSTATAVPSAVESYTSSMSKYVMGDSDSYSAQLRGSQSYVSSQTGSSAQGDAEEGITGVADTGLSTGSVVGLVLGALGALLLLVFL
ncbi:Protein kinase-like domain [Phytophthora cactorum]|nr:Protein kinase-like domain [Phytophthora cactorum]